MNFGSIKPAILAVVASGCGCPAEWRDQKASYVGSDRVVAWCSLGRTKMRGSVDEVRTEYDGDQPQGEEMRDTVVAWREMVLSVQVQSLDTTDAKDAIGYLETLRTRLRMRSYIDALAAVNVSYVGTLATVPNPTPIDEHIASMATLDVRLSLTIAEADANRFGYIKTVDMQGSVT